MKKCLDATLCKSVFETKSIKPVVRNIFHIKKYDASCYTIKDNKKNFFLDRFIMRQVMAAGFLKRSGFITTAVYNKKKSRPKTFCFSSGRTFYNLLFSIGLKNLSEMLSKIDFSKK